MFESAELGHKVAKRLYDRRLSALRYALLEAQLKVQAKAEFPVVVVVGGEDGSGRGEVVNLLLEWMDPRHIRVHASDAPADGERGRPPMWRFWYELPPKGKMGIFFGGWYGQPIADRVFDRIGGAEFARQLAEVSRFERMLVDEGYLFGGWVRPAHRRRCVRPHRGRRVRPPARRGLEVRAHAGGRGGSRRQALVAPHEEGPEPALR